MTAIVEDKNIFYVYAHFRATDNRCFYIGKGKGARAHTTNGRNQHWKNVVAKHGFTVQIVQECMTEQDAFDLEVACIDFYRWAGVDLANITNGGDGAAGLLWSSDRREKTLLSLRSEKNKKASSERSKKNWADPLIRQKATKALSEVFSNPDVKNKMSKRMLSTWSEEGYRKKQNESRIESWKSQERKAKASLMIASTWENDKIRQKRIDGILSRLQTEDARKKTASSMHTPEAKANNRAAIKKAFENPETRRRQFDASQLAFSRPEVIEKKSKSLVDMHKKRKEWALTTGYIGSLNKITIKMMEAHRAG